MRHQRRPQLAFAGLAAMLLAACSQPVRVDSSWHGEPVASPADRILVVAVGADLNGRRQFEDLLVQKLVGSGNTAWASSRKMDTSAPLDRDTVSRAVTDTGATLVVVTRLAHREFEIGKTGEAGSAKVQRKHDTPMDFFRYDYEITDAQTYLVPTATVGLSTDVYSTGDGGLVYTVDTLVPPRENRLEIMSEAAAAISRRLRKDGLVR